MPMTEKIELLGKNVYTDIPEQLTLTAISTASELEYIAADDFDKTMLDKILPKCIEENINFYDLLEMDYQWILRCLRILNYGPYFSVNRIFCGECNTTNSGDYQVNLNGVDCIPLPPDFTGDIKISRNEFLDNNNDIVIRLLTIKEALNAAEDQTFSVNGQIDTRFARMCYMIKEFGSTKGMTPVELKLKIENELSSADYIMLSDLIREKTDYGLRAGGHCQCPKCGSKEAVFAAFVDDRYFRPTLADLRKWKADRNGRKDEDTDGSQTADVRERDGRDLVHSTSLRGSSVSGLADDATDIHPKEVQ